MISKGVSCGQILGGNNIMVKFLIGVLLILFGIGGPLMRGNFRGIDIAVLIVMGGSGIAIILHCLYKMKSQDSGIYTTTEKYHNLDLFDKKGEPSIKTGEQLYIKPYVGEKQTDMAIVTDKGIEIGLVPEEFLAHLTEKLESHQIIHITAEEIAVAENRTLTITVKMTC